MPFQLDLENLQGHCRICLQRASNESATIPLAHPAPSDCGGDPQSVAELLRATMLPSDEPEAANMEGGHLCQQCYATLLNVQQFRSQCTVLNEFFNTLVWIRESKDEDSLLEMLKLDAEGNGLRRHLCQLGVISSKDVSVETLLAELGIVKGERALNSMDVEMEEPDVNCSDEEWVGLAKAEPEVDIFEEEAQEMEECQSDVDYSQNLKYESDSSDESPEASEEELAENPRVKKKCGPKPGSKRLVVAPIACLLPDCGELLNGQTYKDHLKEAHRYGCKQCGVILKCKISMDIHVRGHANAPAVKCSFCDMEFASSAKMRAHARSIHGQQPANYECEQCGEKFEMRQHLKAHRITHLPTDCIKCTAKFDHPTKLFVHLKRMHAETLITCHLCSKGIPTEIFLKDHLMDHKEHVVQNIKDTYVILNLKSLPTYDCPKCEKQFMSDEYCQAHMPRHDPVTRPKMIFRPRPKKELAKLELKYHCTQCDARFRIESSFVQHMKRHETSSVVCDTCGEVFKTKYNLQHHLIYKHSNDRRFFCDLCPKVFATSSDRTRHRRVHTNERPYSCHLCDARCKTNCALKKHLRTHSDEKIFRCDLCDRSYKSADGLSGHKARHSNQRALKCFYCEQHFNIHKNRRRHILKHHPGQPVSEKERQAAELVEGESNSS